MQSPHLKAKRRSWYVSSCLFQSYFSIKGSSQEVHQYRGSLCDRRLRRVRDTHVAKGSFSFDAWRFLDVRFDLGDRGESVSPAGLAAYDDGRGDSSPIEEQMLARLGLRR